MLDGRVNALVGVPGDQGQVLLQRVQSAPVYMHRFIVARLLQKDVGGFQSSVGQFVHVQLLNGPGEAEGEFEDGGLVGEVYFVHDLVESEGEVLLHQVDDVSF